MRTLMAGALAVATYHSRSIVPAAAAAVIVVVLLPSLKATLLATFPQLAWGTGYGSSWIALVLLLLAFRLREADFLRALGEGDRFLGREPFPLRRFDHTLFTGPLLASVLFLVGKVDTWTVLNRPPPADLQPDPPRPLPSRHGPGERHQDHDERRARGRSEG
jgi:hypothetical protein